MYFYTFVLSRSEGGVEAERKERDRWISQDRQRIQDSVNGQYEWEKGPGKYNYESVA